MRTKITTIACLAVAGAVATTSSAAAATPTFGFKTATYRIEVSGVQTTAWKSDHLPEFECDIEHHGEATEVIRFAGKPFTAKVTSYSASDPTFLVGKKFGAQLELPATITRRSNYKQIAYKACASGDGTAPNTAPPPSDCGQRKTTVDAEVRFKGGRLMLDDSGDLVVPLPLYRNCVIGGTAYPNMLYTLGKNAVGKPLTGRALYRGPKVRVVTVGRRDEFRDNESWHETTLKYTIKLTRLTKVRSF
jgi:hypothetical protein